LFALPPVSFGNARSAEGDCGSDYGRAPGAFGPEAIAEMSEVLDAAFEKLRDTGEPDVVIW
jgi:hypothetical protein